MLVTAAAQGGSQASGSIRGVSDSTTCNCIPTTTCILKPPHLTIRHLTFSTPDPPIFSTPDFLYTWLFIHLTLLFFQHLTFYTPDPPIYSTPDPFFSSNMWLICSCPFSQHLTLIPKQQLILKHSTSLTRDTSDTFHVSHVPIPDPDNTCLLKNTSASFFQIFKLWNLWNSFSTLALFMTKNSQNLFPAANKQNP